MNANGSSGANGDYAVGVEALQSGDLNRAQAAFDKVLAGSPTHAGALNGSGLIAARRGDRSTAVRRFKTAMGVAPDFVAPIQNLAHLIRESHPHEAVVLYQKAVKKDPKNPEFLIALTAILERLGDDTAAEGVAREGLKAFRDHPALLAVAASCQSRAGKRDEALSTIDRGEPDSGWDARIRQMWHYRRARILDSLDRLDEALAEAERGHATLEALNPNAFAERAQFASDVRALGSFFADRADLRPQGNAGHDRCFILGLPGSGVERLTHLMDANEAVSARRDVPAIMQVVRGIYGNPVIPRVAEEALLTDARRHYENQMRQDDAIKVDGYDLNICFAGLIDQLFPKSQTVLITRHPVQACLQLKLSGAEPKMSRRSWSKTCRWSGAPPSLRLSKLAM